jgi:hypothetical protein
MITQRRNFKRILVMADNHAGLETGLTPPSWQYRYINGTKDNNIKRRNRIFAIQNEMWNWYENIVKSLQPIDILFHLGDCIEGFGKKNAGTELITSDMIKQCEIASECINMVNAKEKILTFGTAYHSGAEVDYEEIVAKNVNASKIGSHEWVSINGIVFDLKHYIGNSNSPYNRGVSVAKDQLWNLLWAEKNLAPKSDILLRGHVHYDYFVGNSDFLAMTLPGLCWGSKFGNRICKGLVSIGLTVFDVYPNGHYDWHYEIARFQSQKPKVIEL